MTEGKMIAFTDNCEDNSTEAGFEFTFFCDICNEGYKTRFVQSKTYKKRNFFQNIGKIASAAGDVIGSGGLSTAGDTGSDVLSQKYEGMSPEWHKEHQAAFEAAQNEAQGHFHRCPKCAKWVCDNDWNEEVSLCVEDAPRESVEVAAARAEKMKQDIQAKAEATQVFTGKIEQRQALCPVCGKPAGQGKFCNNCGANLSLGKCPQCGAQNPKGARFCSECGGKI